MARPRQRWAADRTQGRPYRNQNALLLNCCQFPARFRNEPFGVVARHGVLENCDAADTTSHPGTSRDTSPCP